jgi:hypothetical protein
MLTNLDTLSAQFKSYDNGYVQIMKIKLDVKTMDIKLM